MNVSKKYNSSFVVEKSKLTRLLSVINERMALLQQPIQQTYETHLSGQKNVTNSSIEEILSLDNSRRSKIERLVLLQKSVTQVPAVTEHQIEVDFDGKSPTDVTVSIRGTDARWVTESMSVVEEQVERTLEKTLFHLLFNSRAMVFFIALVIFLLAGVASLRYPALNSRSDPLANTMWLSPMDLTALGKSLEQSTLSPADRIADVQTRQLRNLISAQTDSPFSFLTDWRVLIAMSPLIVLLVALAALRPCYPSAVFLWGDIEDWYGRIVARRKTILTVVISSVLIGVLTNLAVFGFGSLLSPPSK